MSVPHLEIEPKWQAEWEKQGAFISKPDAGKPKYYVLDMFPYPSSSGLHVGHPEGYTATDIVSRYKRARGFNVLHPMGWDAFGLPAEQYAIQTGVHPAITTKNSMENFRRQLKSFGFSYDWSREISTCDPSYYKWTQFIFAKLFERGLAYQKEVPVNWCPALRTVLANEEIVDGKSERGGHPVYRVPMKQWMLRITSYAERLINDLDLVDWPERTKEAQRNWIGKSQGVRVKFTTNSGSIEIFTTRADTLFGVTFLVLAPEHPQVEALTTPEHRSAVKLYQEKTSRKSAVDRQIAKDKSGEFTGSYAVHPITGTQIPIWISDYVLMEYGTGAIMAVPGHDERDHEFATTFQIPILSVIEASTDSKSDTPGGPVTNDGRLINSGVYTGLLSPEARLKITQHLESNGKGVTTTLYKLRDWLFSRQRYWGEPFPIVHGSGGGPQTVPLQELPVTLPEVADYEPSESGESPLARNQEWCVYPQGGTRETDTMPGSAGSSWYFLRYIDPHNDSEPFSFEAQKYWMPVDLYLGGPEHTVGHLLYARFWHKVLFDLGLVSTPEPFQKLVHQGMILGLDGEKMSKSRGNVINPDDVVQKYGADSLRLYLMFLGPIDRDKPWATNGIDGVRRFLDRFWRLCLDENKEDISGNNPPSEETLKLLHKTIKKVTEDLESLSFNTAISQMMILVNDLYKANERPKSVLLTLCQLLMPFAPHTAEELWASLGGKGLVSLQSWPEFDENLVQNDAINIGVQVNGKMRGTVSLALDEPEESAVEKALKIAAVCSALGRPPGESGGRPPIGKVIYKAGKILNLIGKKS